MGEAGGDGERERAIGEAVAGPVVAEREAKGRGGNERDEGPLGCGE